MMNLSAPEFIPSATMQPVSGSSISPTMPSYTLAEKPPSLASNSLSSNRQKHYVHNKPTSSPKKYKNNARKGGKTTTVIATGPSVPPKSSKKSMSKSELLEEELSVFEQPTANSLLTSPNKRGHVSLTHLLNFSFPPRQTQSHGKKRFSASYTAFNKERFVNANYRFVMKEEGNYAANLIDPDRAVEWNDVVQVVMPTSNHITCPICLHEPVAAKVTKCGHVYCWHCLQQYLSIGNQTTEGAAHSQAKKWKKCPICYDAVYLKDVKSVKIIASRDLCRPLGASPRKERVPPCPERPVQLKMTLMKRALLSSVALPRNGYQDWEMELVALGKSVKKSEINKVPVIPPSVSNVHAMLFSKMLIATPEYYLNEILLREKRELENVLSEMYIENGAQGIIEEEKVFVDACLEELKVSSSLR
jgi:hypothetical protein